MLATLGSLDADAAAYAVDTAVESGELLLVVNATQLEPLPMSLRLGYDALEEFTPEVTASLKRPVELAASLGIRVERTQCEVRGRYQALLQLIAERGVGLLVFGRIAPGCRRGPTAGRRE